MHANKLENITHNEDFKKSVEIDPELTQKIE